MEETLATPLQAKLARAAELTAAIAQRTPIDLVKELAELKVEIQSEMQNLDTARTTPIAGYYGLRSFTTTLVVDDEEKVAAWLEENPDVFDPESFWDRRLNVQGLKKLADDTKLNTGELIPGTREVKTESFTLKKATIK